MFKLHSLTRLLALLVYAAWAVLMPHGGCAYDVDCWSQWAAWIFDHGLGQAYGSGTNYLPGHLYEFKLLTMLFDSKEAVIAHIYYLKYFSLIFDTAGALLVASLVQNPVRQACVLLAVLLNVAFLHNTVIWAQFDTVFSTILFASFLAAYRRKTLLSSILFLLALNFKLQSVILLPALALLMVQRAENPTFRKFVTGSAILLLIQAVILLPFFLQSQARWILIKANDQGGKPGPISLNASTAWQWLIEGGDLRWMSDKIEYHGVSLKLWGLFLVAVSYLLFLWPLLKSALLRLRNKPYTETPLSMLFAAMAACALVFFYFNTQMHERYSFPAFLPLAALAAVTGKWWPYVIFSAAYLLNNEGSLQTFKKNLLYDTFMFDYRFSSLLLFILIVGLFILERSGIEKPKTVFSAETG